MGLLQTSCRIFCQTANCTLKLQQPAGPSPADRLVRRTGDSAPHSLLKSHTPCLSMLCRAVLWEICTREVPVRGQIRDIQCAKGGGGKRMCS